MHITVKNLFAVCLKVFAVSVTLVIVPLLAREYLPPNRITHECVSNGNESGFNPFESVSDPTQINEQNKQQFCARPMSYDAEFRKPLQSLYTALNYTAGPTAVLSGLITITLSPVMLYRRVRRQ